MLAEKAALFNSLKFDNQKELQDSILNTLALTQKEIEQTHLNHFIALKLLCNKNQKENFNLLTDELIHLFNPKREPK
jgi:protein CpxP